VIAEIDGEPGRHFMWIHFSDPHERYLRHDPPASFGRTMRDRYDGEVRFMDQAFAEVAAALETSAWGKRAAVLFLSDHGEAFGEHGTTYHGRTSHDEELRVPCWMKVPGRTSARAIATPVSTIDVAPTVLDILGIDAGVAFDGVSWASILRGDEQLPERDLFSMVYKRKPLQYAVIRGTRKAIFSPRPRLAAVYDLVADPQEQEPLDLGEREIRELTDRLAGWLAATEP
jgi:arylsulfatase A-like enzyme